jgi:uncharacterized membrane protein YhhN
VAPDPKREPSRRRRRVLVEAQLDLFPELLLQWTSRKAGTGAQMSVIGILIAKLLDPIGIILAGIAGWFCRAWWHVALAAVIVAGLVELVLFSTQLTRMFNPVIFLIGVVASAVWTALAFWLKDRRQKGRQTHTTGE